MYNYLAGDRVEHSSIVSPRENISDFSDGIIIPYFYCICSGDKNAWSMDCYVIIWFFSFENTLSS